MAKTTENKQELVLVDPKEFGIEQDKAIIIANSFSSKQTELAAYQDSYNEIITSELTPELSKKAKELGNKLVKVRTGIAAIHKVEKAFYLAGGKFVDALKNKLTMNVEQMEEKLEEIEQHFVKIETDRKAKLKADRLELLLPYEVIGVEHFALDEMNEEQFNSLLETNKTAFESKKEQERLAEIARIEAEKKAEQERAEAARLEAERIEAQRLENERLKKEAEAREKELAAERKKLAEEQAEKDRLAKIESDRLAKIAADAKAESDKLSAELKAKKDAEDKAQAEEKARIEAEENERIAKAKALANADDQTKVKEWFTKYDALIKEFPELSSDPGKAMNGRVKEALAMTRKLIIDDSKTLL